MFDKEIATIKHFNLYRERKIFPKSFRDFASNDYLGLSNKKILAKKAAALAISQDSHSPKASLLINGYSPLHQNLESMICKQNGFDDCIILGSGFLANIALFDALVRKNDKIYIDEKYHASGIYAAKSLGERVIYFKHNDAKDLSNKINTTKPKGRIIIAIEGIYSMDGDIAQEEFSKIACNNNAILIVDEAHSNGSIGNNLLGYFDHYQIPIQSNFIKMGTLSKAYGSYGAYIAADKKIIDFLCNRAKSIIYTTALSIFDTALALVNLEYIQQNKQELIKKIHLHKKIVHEVLGIYPLTQIITIPFKNISTMQQTYEILQKQGFLVGAIRKPTVTQPILRIVLSIKNSPKDTEKLCKIIKKLKVIYA
ncbi:pyridoxal phosphate-dependent aminotransferase family protein [Helicobacter sp. 13S00477-4]|uniref:aminotransferase class I/II-fold pyridoxal phosphate-dependent enzyme n=1 Tax=Helicobacter sp. 13S00477-4 TaxID=1905759 RepID=UPI000BA73608|nr:pyridoxal phosphate-dependent aminotransferase family protein [Helicobacter sp. 13S00477-4]PAF52157.1 8-amino-7-oxononanoate synthase [Helicobacter sp. 13S00477-4]